MQKPILSIKNLSVHFSSPQASKPAVIDLNLEVNKGQIVAIVGESGSGKSVTALSILKLLPQPPAIYEKGEIEFDNNGTPVEILNSKAGIVRHLRGNIISMIFQEPMTSLNPLITCGNQVMENLLQHQKMDTSAAKQKTLDLFHQVQLPDPLVMFDQYPHQISGGQKQRVMIAMAMICEPALLICDEPTTALDVTVQKNILQLLKQLQVKNNMAVIFISHDLAVVADIADTIIVMYKGQIVEQGTARSVLNSPSHPYTKALLACRPSLHNKNECLPVVSDFMEIDHAGLIHEKPLQINQHLQKPKIPANHNIVLEVKNLVVSYPLKKNFIGKTLSVTYAVNDVSFNIYKGETLGLVGESGCGKTTLGRTVLGLIQPASGTILFNNENIHSGDNKRFRNLRKKMQLVFQDPYSSLDPRQKIGEAIEEPLKVHGLYKSSRERREKVIDLLKKVSLEADIYHRYPHEFSGGQRQRIVIARALALEPEFIVCDESVSALDVSVQAQVLNLINDLKDEFNFTAIFISHDLSVVRYISDRIMVMNKGKIEEIGIADEIYNNPASAYTRQLLDSLPKAHPF